MSTLTTGAVDGRRQRRQRNRDAVVDALLSFYDEGALAPSSDDIAERAGISARSLFRYFDDLDDLVCAAIARQQSRLAPLLAVDAAPEQPLDERIERFVAVRVRLLEAMGNVGRVARLRAPEQPLIAAELRRVRAELRRQLAELFAPELGGRPAAVASTALAALDVVCSWESYDLLRHDQGLGRADATRAMAAALASVLGAG